MDLIPDDVFMLVLWDLSGKERAGICTVSTQWNKFAMQVTHTIDITKVKEIFRRGHGRVGDIKRYVCGDAHRFIRFIKYLRKTNRTIEYIVCKYAPPESIKIDSIDENGAVKMSRVGALQLI